MYVHAYVHPLSLSSWKASSVSTSPICTAEASFCHSGVTLQGAILAEVNSPLSYGLSLLAEVMHLKGVSHRDRVQGITALNERDTWLGRLRCLGAYLNGLPVFQVRSAFARRLINVCNSCRLMQDGGIPVEDCLEAKLNRADSTRDHVAV